MRLRHTLFFFLFFLPFSGKTDDIWNEDSVQFILQLPYDQTVADLPGSYSKLKRSLQWVEKGNDKKLTADVLKKLGTIAYLKGSYEESLEYLTRSMKIFSDLGLELDEALVLADIAYQGKKRDLDRSLQQMQEAVANIRRLEHLSGLSSTVNNLGVLYEMKGDYKKAGDCYSESYSISSQLKDSIGMAHAIINLSYLAGLEKKYEEAREYIRQADEIRQAMKDDYGLAWNRYYEAELWKEEGNLEKALEQFNKAIELCEKVGYPDLLGRSYRQRSEMEAELGRYKEAYFSFGKFFQLHDSLFNEKMQKQALQLEAEFDSEMKDLKISKQDEEIKRKELEKNFYLIAILLSVIIIVAAIYTARKFRRANQIIEHQKREVELQKDLIEEKNKEVLDSITYAQHIQNALIGSDKNLSEKVHDHFVLFKPKDIVSGDFYWSTINENGFFLCVADCTGHGVPGAFMSLLNISFLNEAVIEKGISSTSQILGHVRSRLMHSLGGEEGTRDGMDAVLIRIFPDNKSMQFSLANNPLVIVHQDGETEEIKPDKMPVGKYSQTLVPFTLHEREIVAGDCFYAFSDGYGDQFGGEKTTQSGKGGKKFKQKNLIRLISQSSRLPMQQQKEIFEKTLADWKGDLEQIDDILLFGIKPATV